MKLDKRNPFASYGFEQEVYTKASKETAESEGMIVMGTKGEGFVCPITEDEDNYNTVAPVAKFNKKSGEVFFSNDDNMQPAELQTRAFAHGEQIEYLQEDASYNDKELAYKWMGEAETLVEPKEEEEEEEVKYTITVKVAEGQESMGTVTGSGEYDENAEQQIQAIPQTGYKFVKWNDGNTNATRTITVTEDATYTAEFEEEEGE